MELWATGLLILVPAVLLFSGAASHRAPNDREAGPIGGPIRSQQSAGATAAQEPTEFQDGAEAEYDPDRFANASNCAGALAHLSRQALSAGPTSGLPLNSRLDSRASGKRAPPPAVLS